MNHRVLLGLAAAAGLTIATLSFGADKKPGATAPAKPASSAKTAPSASAPPAASVAPPAASTAPTTAPAASDPPAADAKASVSLGGDAKADPKGSDKSGTPPKNVENPNDPRELPDTWYIFLGARYRGNILPQFILNLAVNEGTTVYSNSVGIEAEFRKNGFSIIPALTFTEFGMDDTLFLEKGKADGLAGNWSLVGSGLKGIYGSADFLWSKKINKMLDFEFGFGVGLGTTFGNLKVNWVYEDPNGSIVSSGGRRFSECKTDVGTGAGSGAGCTPRDHSFAKVSKVGGYDEPSWFNGGSKPSFLPLLTVPVGLRIKPVSQFAGRVQVGLSLTGFWFGISGAYGLPGKKSAPAKSNDTEVEETVE